MAELERCVVCGRERPTSRMRFGRHKVPVGGSEGRSRTVRTGNRHGTATGGGRGTRFSNSNYSGASSRRSDRIYYRTIPGYACRYHGLLGRIVTRLVIVGVLAFIAYAYLDNRFGSGRQAAHRHSQVTADSAPDAASPRTATNADQPATEPQGTSSSPSDLDTASSKSSAPALSATLIADPSSDPRVDDAMKEALATGEPQRWHVHKLHGYAVPSAPDASGCRMIQVSIDETGDKSSATKLCP